ncbi:hypothetical protein Tco_1097517, partial [Tanacetum coccineum]
ETIRQEVDIPQSNFPTQTPVADEVTFTGVNVVHGGAATIVSSIDARQGGGNIRKSPTIPHDSPLLGGHTLRSDEGSLPLHELTVLCTKLSNKVESSETELKQTKQIYGDAFTKLIKKVKKLEQTVQTSQDRRRAKFVVSDDEEDKEDPSKHGRKLNTASTFVSTASPQRHINTTAKTLMEIRKSAAKTMGKAIMQESKQPKKIKKKVQIQMSLEEGLAQKLHKEEQAKFNAQHEAKKDAEGFTDAEWDDVLARIAADEDFVQ